MAKGWECIQVDSDLAICDCTSVFRAADFLCNRLFSNRHRRESLQRGALNAHYDGALMGAAMRLLQLLRQ